MGEAHSTNGRDKKLIQIPVGNVKIRDHFEDLAIDGRILERILQKECGMDSSGSG
jgi:hypothetical protein